MNLYIDESGSINTSNKKEFIISVIIPKDIDKLKRAYKRFVSKNLARLKELDKDNKMFRKDGTFLELKGSCFDRDMKLEFLEYFCKNNLFKVRYIVLDNTNIEEKFTENKARTFNYLMKLFLTNTINQKMLNDRDLFLHIDERNIKTNSKFSLEDYLHQELILGSNIIDKVQVEYYDSSQSKLIQIADVFSNIKYSNYLTEKAYQSTLEKYQKDGYILPDFNFPQYKGLKKIFKK